MTRSRLTTDQVILVGGSVLRSHFTDWSSTRAAKIQVFLPGLPRINASGTTTLITASQPLI